MDTGVRGQTSGQALGACLDLTTPMLVRGRRSFLQIGALGLSGLGVGGWSLDQLLRTEAQAAALDPAIVRGKSVVFLFLHGGPSQIETFDPKGGAPGRDPQCHRRSRHATPGDHIWWNAAPTRRPGRPVDGGPLLHDG